MYYLLIVTDLANPERRLDADGWGDEWEIKADNEQEAIEGIRERAAAFHDIPIERIDAYVYATNEGEE